MLPFKLIYHDRYDLNLGAHVFPSQKYRLIHDRLLAENFAQPEDFIAPQPASDQDILRVHDRGWVQRLKMGTLSAAEIAKLEIPFSDEMVEGVWLATGGTILGARNALRDRIGFNIGGGFHHAFRAHGEGFCAINDVAVAIRALQHDGSIQRALVVDLDVHHGNGTAAIFSGDASVLTLSLHQFNNYPAEKPPSVIDVHLRDRVGDAEYLARLRESLTVALSFSPDMIFYLAGADPFEEDQLGGLSLTINGLKQRDNLVFETAVNQNVPVAVVLAGGYARNTEDTVTIHCNTAQAALTVVSNLAQTQPPISG
ncbi:MAG TPA: histone deacetylase [Bryobacteraceae bacterium]|nr:histone deacetylase [Bryobacteraceae bacterium]